MKMSNVLAEFGDEILSLKAKFAEARKELQIDEVETHRPKMLHHPRSFAYTGNRQAERGE